MVEVHEITLVAADERGAQRLELVELAVVRPLLARREMEHDLVLLLLEVQDVCKRDGFVLPEVEERPAALRLSQEAQQFADVGLLHGLFEIAHGLQAVAFEREVRARAVKCDGQVARNAADLPQDGDTVHALHENIENQEVWQARLQRGQQFLARRESFRADADCAFLVDERLDGLDGVGFIVADVDQQFISHAVPLLLFKVLFKIFLISYDNTCSFINFIKNLVKPQFCHRFGKV